MNISIGFITSRREPKFQWMADSLFSQLRPDDEIDLVVIDSFKDEPGRGTQLFKNLTIPRNVSLRHNLPKPTIWAGKHRLTREDWWSKSSSLNSFICLAAFPFIAFVDDRCVLWRAWLDRVKVAMEEGYAVCGSYEKYINLKVENGVVVGSGESLGNDTRTPGNYPFDSWYGGSGALPLDWCLAVNGYNESYCDSLGLEDSMFGVTLRNSGYPVRYDSDMRIIEDRTQGQIDGALKRSDWGISPNDCSHKIVEIMRDKTTSQNSYDIRDLRDRVLAGEPFPPPAAGVTHWFTGQPISEL